MSELNFKEEFDLNPEKTELDFEGFGSQRLKENNTPDEVIPVYDVILAGVK